MKGPLVIGLAIFVILITLSITRYIAQLTTVTIPKDSVEAPLPPTGPTVKIKDQVFRVDVADTLLTRNRGLSGRDGLDEDAGMYFIFTIPSKYGFWMKGMKFPIDIIWISKDKIVGFSEDVHPEPGTSVFKLKTYYPPESVNRVLEVRAGTVARYGFEVGDTAIFTP